MNGWKITPLLCASVLWGTTGTAQALAHLHAAPPAIGAARLLSGGLALWLVIAVRGRIALRELMALAGGPGSSGRASPLRSTRRRSSRRWHAPA